MLESRPSIYEHFLDACVKYRVGLSSPIQQSQAISATYQGGATNDNDDESAALTYRLSNIIKRISSTLIAPRASISSCLSPASL